MAEYWKSTPKYWCKFCEIYVRDTGIERKNHEASGKHQGNIQRSLRDLHKGQARQQRDEQNAKNEVARLNGLIGGKGAKASPTTLSQPAASNKPRPSRIDPGPVDYAAHRKAQALQLAAMGLQVPDELKEDVTGVGAWQIVSQRTVEHDLSPAAQQGIADDPLMRAKGVHKRKAEDNQDEVTADEPASSKRKAWGSSFKSYPGKTKDDDDAGDLDALLTGVNKKKPIVSTSEVQTVAEDEEVGVKHEASSLISSVDNLEVKQEHNATAVTAPPIVAFKKRKGKR